MGLVLKQGVTDFFSGKENHLTKHSCILACIHTCLLKDFYTGKHDYFHTCTHTHLHIWMVAYLHTWKLVNLLTWKLANLHTSQGISVHIEAHFNSNLLKFNIGKPNLEIIQQLVVSRPSRLHIFTIQLFEALTRPLLYLQSTLSWSADHGDEGHDVLKFIRIRIKLSSRTFVPHWI